MESEEMTPETTTEVGETAELVDIDQASDEDLEAFLESATEEESEQTPGIVATAQPTQEKEKPSEAQEQPQVQQEQVSRDEFEKLRRQLEGQELLIKRRTSEIANIKQQLKQFVANQSEGLDEKWQVDPRQAHKAAMDIEKAESYLKNLEQEEQQLNHVHSSQVLVANHVGEMDVEGMVMALQEDNLPPEFVQKFAQNPYASTLPETLVQLAKRAQLLRQKQQYETVVSQLVDLVKKLQSEKQATPSRVAEGISKALRQSPTITASGGAGSPEAKGNLNPAQMSDREIEEFLKSV